MEKSNRHLFKEGAMIIPGQLSFQNLKVIKLQTQFASEDISVSQYVGAKITGVTSGVEADVILAEATTADDPPTLFIQYTKTGTDNITTEFKNDEEIKANKGITHTTSYSTDVSSAKTATLSATKLATDK